MFTIRALPARNVARPYVLASMSAHIAARTSKSSYESGLE